MSRSFRPHSPLVPILASLWMLPAWSIPGCCPDGTFPPCTTDNATVLVNETFRVDDLPLVRNFNPSAAGKTITATVSGDVSNTRLTVSIVDVGAASTVAIDLAPTTSTTTVNFTSTNSGVHVLTAVETSGPSGAYTIVITEI